LNWHWLFYINLIPGAAVTLLTPVLVKIDEPNFSLLKGADYPAIFLMAASLGSLQYVLEEGVRWNWFDDRDIALFSMVAGVAGVLFIIRTLMSANPVFDLRALGNRNFLLGCLLSFITGVGMFSTIYLTPLFLGYIRGYSAWQTGVAIASTGVASLVGVPVFIMLSRRVDTRWLMMFGIALFGLGMWSFTFITHDWGAAELFLPQILRGFPQVFVVAPAVNLGLGSLPPDRLKYASGLFNMMRNLGGAIGIAVCGTILNDRANLHFERLAEHLNATNAAMQGLVQQVSAKYALANGGDFIHGQAVALKKLWSLTWREAQVQTYADAFLVIAICFALATLMVPLLRKVTPPAAPPADAH
jgi:DHA2 family multidrug resistance protein